MSRISAAVKLFLDPLTDLKAEVDQLPDGYLTRQLQLEVAQIRLALAGLEVSFEKVSADVKASRAEASSHSALATKAA